MPLPLKVRARRAQSNRVRSSSKTARPAEVVDTLVLLLAGMLLPAWLLGHLFLTFYPAPESDSENPATATGIVAGLNSGNNSDSASPHAISNNVSDSVLDNEKGTSNLAQNDLSSMPSDDKDRELTQKAFQLQTEIESLKKANEQLTSENSSLKEAADTKSEISGTSNQIAELRQKLKASLEQVTASNDRLAIAEANYNNAERERQRLEESLGEVQKKLQRTEAELATSKNDLLVLDAVGESDQSSFTTIPSGESQQIANDKLKEEANRATTLASQLQTQVANLEQNLNIANNNLASRESDLRVAISTLDEIRIANEKLNTQLADAKQRIAKLELPKEVFRDFVSSKGSVSKMAFIRWEGSDIIVRSFADKRLYRLTLDRFSEADQKYLRERKTSR